MKKSYFVLGALFVILLGLAVYAGFSRQKSQSNIFTGSAISSDISVINGFLFDNPGGNTLGVNFSDGSQMLQADLLYGDGTNFLGYGRDANSRLAISATNTLTFDSDNDIYFAASSTTNSKSYLMRATNFGIAGGINKTTFQYMQGGSWNAVSQDSQAGDFVNIGDLSFQVVSIDTNGHTVTINSSGAYFNRIYDISGTYLYLPSSSIFPTQEFILNFSLVGGGFSNQGYKAYWTSQTVNLTKMCADSDLGINYYLKGGAGNSTVNILDLCSGALLVESYCNLSLSSSNVYTTSYNCSSEGKICQDGACLCVPNWVAMNTSCTNELITTWSNDTNSCGNVTGKPQNITAVCDSDGNGIIGQFGSVGSSNINDIAVFIDGKAGNVSKNYTNGVRMVELKDNGTTLVKFNHNFSSPINFDNISIKDQPAYSTFGYTLISGVSDAKTVYVLRKNESNQVCIKDSEVSSISDISSDCKGSNEYSLICPSQYSEFNCTLSGNYFVITGLSHSGVKEFISSSSCVVNWTCSVWGACLNGNQTRTCTDSNNCSTIAGRPVLTQSCNVLVGNTCISNWSCGNWLPETCPSNGNQTRTCTDTNRCGANTKNESQNCEYQSSSDWVTYLLIGAGLVAFIILIVIMILFLKGKKGKSDSSSQQFTKSPPSPSPPSLPPGPQMPVQVPGSSVNR